MIAPVPIEPTLPALIERHYLPFIAPTCAALTLKDYRAALQAWSRFGEVTRPVSGLYADDFQRFATAARGSGLSPATINKWLRVYRAACTFGLHEGIIDRVPIMRPLAVDEQIKWRPTLDELSRLHRACRVATWPDRAGGPVQWWRAFLVLSYVGALRRSDVLNHLRWDQVQADGIHGRRVKRKRLTFVPLLPCVQQALDSLKQESALILPCPAGSRQFKAAQDAIGRAAGISWTPHALKRAGTDAWYRADPSGTCAHIVGHARLSVTIRSYLDRVMVLNTHAPQLPIPAAFGGETTPKTDAEFLKLFRRLSAADREQVRAIAERLVS